MHPVLRLDEAALASGSRQMNETTIATMNDTGTVMMPGFERDHRLLVVQEIDPHGRR